MLNEYIQCIQMCNVSSHGIYYMLAMHKAMAWKHKHTHSLSASQAIVHSSTQLFSCQGSVYVLCTTG